MPRTTNVYDHPFTVDMSGDPDRTLRDDPNLFVTNDLLLAGYLLYLDREPDVVLWATEAGRQTCFWAFRLTISMGAEVGAFNMDEAKVEPRRFYRSVNTARAAMNDSRHSGR